MAASSLSFTFTTLAASASASGGRGKVTAARAVAVRASSSASSASNKRTVHKSVARVASSSPLCAAAAATAATATTRGGKVNAGATAADASTIDWEALDAELQDQTVIEILDRALEIFGDELAIAFSGAEDVALIQYASLTGRPFRVFSLDTGRLNPETYQLFDEVEKHFNIKIEFTFPDEKAVTDLVNEKGMFSFFEDGHKECCGVRKVQPLRRKLKTLKAWVTGQRKDQSPGTRMAVPAAQVDPVFEGVDGGPGSLIKFNPLTNATSQEVWDFLRVMGTPVNKLHEMGYVSIGCAPCTRAVLPGQQEREGRWWWEDSAMKECGLHSGRGRATTDVHVSRRRVLLTFFFFFFFWG